MERSSRRVAKEKWSASRAVKVVSLANETNIRADRVDKRRERAERGERPRGRRWKERRCPIFDVLALKLTRAKEFRFLYNRFNLIPRASRPFRRGCERRKNIYFRGIRLFMVTAWSFLFLLSLTRAFLHLTIRLFVIFFFFSPLLLSCPLFMHI